MPNKHLPLQEIARIQAKHELTIKNAEDKLVAAPMTLDPTEMPLATFQTLPAVMPLFNLLIDRIARDSDYLINQVGPTDVFSQKMADIVRKVYTDENPHKSPSDGTSPLCQTMMLGLLRSDYLFDEKAAAITDNSVQKSFAKTRVPLNQGWKQVEINTIASSFPALSTRTGLAYEEIKRSLLEMDKDNAIGHGSICVSSSERDIITALDRAHRQFLTSYPSETLTSKGIPSSLPVTIVFVVQEGERNVGDQSLLRRGLESLGIKVVRKSLVDLNKDLTLEDKTHFARLRVRSTDDGGEERFGPDGVDLPVSIFYFRGLYDYSEYEKYPEFSWDVRLKIEKTMSIKCPSVPYHMCTWKIIQKQLFNEPELLKRFIPDEDQAAVLRDFMVPHYTLTNFETDENLKKLINDAISNPHSYIVKTLKEGYGFILDGQEMVDALKKLTSDDKTTNQDEWKSKFAANHLLVYRINSKSRAGAILKNGELHEFEDLEGEFGTYGAILTDSDSRVIFNMDAGYLLRTKSKSNMGGGVMSGVSALDAVEFV